MLTKEKISEYKKELQVMNLEALEAEKRLQLSGFEDINTVLIGGLSEGKNIDTELVKNCDYTSNCLIERVAMIDHFVLLDNLESSRVARIKDSLKSLHYSDLQESYDSIMEEKLTPNNKEMINLLLEQMDSRPTAEEITKQIDRFFPGAVDDDLITYEKVKEILITAVFDKEIIFTKEV